MAYTCERRVDEREGVLLHQPPPPPTPTPLMCHLGLT